MLCVYRELRWCSVFFDILSTRTRQGGAWLCPTEEENDEKVEYLVRSHPFSKQWTECEPEV